MVAQDVELVQVNICKAMTHGAFASTGWFPKIKLCSNLAVNNYL